MQLSEVVAVRVPVSAAVGLAVQLREPDGVAERETAALAVRVRVGLRERETLAERVTRGVGVPVRVAVRVGTMESEGVTDPVGGDRVRLADGGEAEVDREGLTHALPVAEALGVALPLSVPGGVRVGLRVRERVVAVGVGARDAVPVRVGVEVSSGVGVGEPVLERVPERKGLRLWDWVVRAVLLQVSVGLGAAVDDGLRVQVRDRGGVTLVVGLEVWLGVGVRGAESEWEGVSVHERVCVGFREGVRDAVRVKEGLRVSCSERLCVAEPVRVGLMVTGAVCVEGDREGVGRPVPVRDPERDAEGVVEGVVVGCCVVV